MELYHSVHEPFVRFCTAKAYDIMDDEELISETVLRAFENFEKLKSKKAFLGFLFGISQNIIRNNLRKKKLFTDYNEIAINNIADNTIDSSDRLDIEILYNALNKLPANQKEALILFEISGFSIKEIMEIQNAKESAIKQRLKRARKKLAKILNCSELTNESTEKKSKILMSIFL